MSYDPYIVCKKAGCNSHDCELHHLIPKFMGGTDMDGRRYLCKKHHHILQNIIPSIIFKYLPKWKQKECKQEIKEFSLKWIEDGTR